MPQSTTIPNGIEPRKQQLAQACGRTELANQPQSMWHSVYRRFILGSIVLVMIGCAVWVGLLWLLGSLMIPRMELWATAFGLCLAGSLFGWAYSVLHRVSALQQSQPFIPSLAISEEHHFRSILESIDLVPWEADIWTWKFLYVGPQAEELLGFPQDHWFSEDFWTQRIHPQDRDVVIERCRWVCLNRSSVQLEYRMKHANGEIIWVHDLVTAPRSLSGVQVFRGCMMNITERKQAENALRQSDERFRNFFELGQIGMAITSPEKGWLQFNEELCQILGYPRTELRKKTWSELTHPEDLAPDVRLFQQVLAGEREGYDLDKRFIHPSGKVIHASISVRCVRDSAGKVQYFLALVQDITQRKQSENALRQSEKRFRELFNSSPDAIFVENQAGYVLDANPMACRLHELRREEMLGKHVSELVPQQVRQHLLDLSQMPEGETIQFESKSLARSESVIPVEIRVNRIEYEGQPAFLFHVRDVTQRKELESKLLQAEKMQAIARVAGTAAHDFNNIMFAISGIVELMKFRPMDSEMNQHLEEIHKAALRAQRLARSLLVESEIDDHLQRVNPAHLLCGNEPLIRSFIPKQVQCSIRCDVKEAYVLADREKLERVVINLVKNAVEAMPDGGTITITLRQVAPDDVFWQLHPDANYKEYLCLDVSDTGHGMSKEVQSRVFEPFFSTRGQKGTGLGLYSVYSTIKQFQGEIDLRSTPEEGTTFLIYLPVHPSDQDPEKPSANEPTISAKEKPKQEAQTSNWKSNHFTILIVDDENIVRPIYKRLLETEGYTVFESDSGKHALELCEQMPEQTIDLLITDVSMPEMNGYQLAKELKGKRPNMKVLYVTGFIDPSQWGDFESVPNDLILQKPFPPDQLVGTVYRLLKEE